jgi:group I intron endonuclease
MKQKTKWLSWNPINTWSKLPNTTGIYEIKNTTTGYCYIGSAVALKRRGHYEKLSNGSSHNKPMQKAFELDGEESFQFRILEFCKADNVVEREQKYIDERNFNTLYNVAPIAGSTLGYTFTDTQLKERSKSKRGVPHSPERKKKVWLKKVEREFKQNLYARLFKDFKKTDGCDLLVKEIKDYADEAPDRKKPIILKEDDGEPFNLGSSLQTWWTFGDGREYVDEKFGFTECDWKYINGTNAFLNKTELEGGFSNSKLYRLIAESTFHKKVAEKIEAAFEDAVQAGEVSLEYKPYVPDDSYEDTGFSISSNSKSIGRYDNGHLEYVEIGNNGTSERQEWYEDSEPKLSVLDESDVERVVKKLWHENGRPEAIMHFSKGELHGPLCKWDKDGRLTFARNYNRGNIAETLSLSEVKELEQFEELLDYSEFKDDDDNMPSISMSFGFD